MNRYPKQHLQLYSVPNRTVRCVHNEKEKNIFNNILNVQIRRFKN